MEMSPTTKESLSKSWLVLDVDGVLLDSGRGGLGSWKEVFSQRFEVNADELREEFFEPFWHEIVAGMRDVVPSLAEALRRLRWDIDVEEALHCWFEADFVPNGDVVKWASDYARRGVSIAIATNQEHRRAKFLKERLAALLPLNGFVYSAQIGRIKSDPYFFIAAEQELDLPLDKHRVVLVDDSPANVRSAQRARWNAVHFDPSLDWRARVETLLVDHFES